MQVGLSTSRLSEIERGDGARAPLETWVALGIALDRPLAVTFSRPIDRRPGRRTPAISRSRSTSLRLARANGRTGHLRATDATDRPAPIDRRRPPRRAPREPGSLPSAGTRSAILAPRCARRTARSPRRRRPGRTTGSRRSGSSEPPRRIVQSSSASRTSSTPAFPDRAVLGSRALVDGRAATERARAWSGSIPRPAV